MVNLNFFSKNWRYLGGSPRIGNSSRMTVIFVEPTSNLRLTTKQQDNKKRSKDKKHQNTPEV